MKRSYIPPYSHIKKQFAISNVKGEPWASIRIDALESLLTELLQAIEVDEEWYLTRYPDVAAAIDAGVVASARAHFIYSGYFEGRRPFPMPVDEDWYVTSYPDIGEAVKDGRIGSADQHFQEFGYDEGRRPGKAT